MGQQSGTILIMISIFFLAVIILTFAVRRSRLLWKPRRSDPQVKFLGYYSPLLTWLRYHRFARMDKQSGEQARLSAFPTALAEVGVILVWALWLGRSYWLTGSDMWLPEDWGLNVQAYFNWSLLGKCGACVFWNGSFNGGAPLFIDLIAALAHPLVILLVLLTGAISASKLMAAAGLIMAGLAQWWWAKEMRFGFAARLWVALLAVTGGHLIGRLQAGLTEMVFSIASASLVIPAAMRLARTGERRMAVVTGVLFGLAILSGQGYMQLALCLAVCPALLILLGGQGHLFRPVWKQFALSALIAILVAAILLVPLAHSAARITKPTNLSNYDQTQPIEYQPLNLVIRDGPYYESEILGKLPWPSQTINYIGWIPVLLALVGLRLVPRDKLRLLAFFLTAIGLIYLLSSGLIFQLLVRLLPVSWKNLATIARFPSLSASLAAPFVLAIAGWGLDLLLQRKDWPGLKLSRGSRAPLSIRLTWLMCLPLIWSVKSVYDFVQPLLVTFPVPLSADSRILQSEIHLTDAQWVEPPLGYWGFDIVALQNGLKLTNVIHNWTLNGRTAPPPYLQITDEEVDPALAGYSGSLQFQSLPFLPYHSSTPQTLYRFLFPDRSYAQVKMGAEGIPCQAHAEGGNIDVDCTADASGQLVVLENAWPGWVVRRDGIRVTLGAGPWLTVQAPSGEHHYSFRYRPWDVPAGGILSLLGIGLSIGLWFGKPGRPKPPGPPPDGQKDG